MDKGLHVEKCHGKSGVTQTEIHIAVKVAIDNETFDATVYVQRMKKNASQGILMHCMRIRLTKPSCSVLPQPYMASTTILGRLDERLFRHVHVIIRFARGSVVIYFYFSTDGISCKLNYMSS